MGKQWKQWQTLFWGGSKITADGECSHEIKRRLLLGRKVMTNLDRILKSRHITLPTKIHLVKAMVFLVVMYECESWTIKKAEELMLLTCGVGEDSWESLGLQGDPTSPPKRNQSWIIGRTDVESETSILWPPDAELTHWKRPWCWERLRAGGEGDDRGWDSWMASLTRWTWVWVDSGVGDGQGGLACCSPWGCRVGHNWATELTELTVITSGMCHHLLRFKEIFFWDTWEEKAGAGEGVLFFC